MATTKYNVGDILMMPFIINAIRIDEKGTKYYLDTDKKFVFSSQPLVINENEFGNLIWPNTINPVKYEEGEI